MSLRAPLVRATRSYSTSASSSIIPFPLPYYVGTDLCSIARIDKLLRKSPARFIRRVMTPREIAELPAAQSPAGGSLSARAIVSQLATADTLPSHLADGAQEHAKNAKNANTNGPLWNASSYLAGRFAAKEAAIKAHPHIASLTLQSIRIARAHLETEHRNNSGPPVAYITLPPTGDSAEHEKPVEQEARVSISHDGQYATAVCMGFKAS